MEYIERLRGRVVSFQQLREECAAAGIAIAGRIAEAKSVRLWLDSVAQCCGAIWAPGMSRRYPAAISGHILELNAETIGPGSIAVDESSDDTADILRAGYDAADVTGLPQKFMTLEASPRRFGGLVKELTFPYIRTAANMEAVGAPVLQRLAGRRYAVALDSSRTEIRPGDWIKIAAHPEWPLSGGDPTIMALAVEVDESRLDAHVSGEYQASFPEIAVTSHSIALPDTVDGSVDIATRQGVATFTVFDTGRKGIPGVRVAIDGGEPLTTNQQGQISFPYVAGHPHEVAIERPGSVSQTIGIFL